MEWTERVDLFCAVVSLIATIVITVLQLWQAKRVEDFERRQDERDERRHAEENRARAVEFVSRHYANRGLIPLCAIAAMHNDLFYYSREMYRNFCCLVPEVQNLILEYVHLDLRMKHEIDLFGRCISATDSVLRSRFPKDESPLYDGGKYVLRSLERYAGDAIPVNRIDCLPKHLASATSSSEGRMVDYGLLVEDMLSKSFRSHDASLTPVSDLEEAYGFKSGSEIEACQFATTIAINVAIFGSDGETGDEDYGCPGGYAGERIETMEDLFLLAVFVMYTRLLLPNEG